MSYFASSKYRQTWLRPARLAMASLAAVITAGDHAGAANGRNERTVAFVESRPGSEPIEPIMAIVSLRDQRITVYDAKGWILRDRYRAAGKDARRQPVSSASSRKKPSTTRTCMTMPTCHTCSASLGRALHFTVALCRDVRRRMAASGCPTTSLHACSARPGWA